MSIWAGKYPFGNPLLSVLSKERRFVLFPFLGMKKTFKFAKADGFGQILLRVSA